MGSVCIPGVDIYAKWQIGLVSNIYRCFRAHRSGSACAHSVATHDSLRPRSLSGVTAIKESVSVMAAIKSWRGQATEVCREQQQHLRSVILAASKVYGL